MQKTDWRTCRRSTSENKRHIGPAELKTDVSVGISNTGEQRLNWFPPISLSLDTFAGWAGNLDMGRFASTGTWSIHNSHWPFPGCATRLHLSNPFAQLRLQNTMAAHCSRHDCHANLMLCFVLPRNRQYLKPFYHSPTKAGYVCCQIKGKAKINCFRKVPGHHK